MPTQLDHQQRVEYRVCQPLNIYDSPQLTTLATQAWVGRYVQVYLRAPTHPDPLPALPACLCEDHYPGWIDPQALANLEPVLDPYQAKPLTRAQIEPCLWPAITFGHQAMAQANRYLWGGTLGPDYDCSGLIQRAFAEQGVWLPRDAYQQEAFCQPLGHFNQGLGVRDIDQLIPLLLPGDLIFFGPPQKANHVALYLGDRQYIHSSGQDQGRNGIGIDRLTADGDPVSVTYYQQIRGAGRVVSSFLLDPT